MESKISGTHLTVIIRDDAPIIHFCDVPLYRRVTISLSTQQVEQLKLYATSISMGKPVFESISKCFIED